MLHRLRKPRVTFPKIPSLTYLRSLILFAFRRIKLLYVAIALAIISGFLEVAAINLLLPLGKLASGAQPTPGGFTERILSTFLLQIDARSLLLALAVLLAVKLIVHLTGQVVTVYCSRRLHLLLNFHSFRAVVTNVPIAEVEKKSIGYYVSLIGDETGRSSALIMLLTQLFNIVILSTLYFIAIVLYAPWVALSLVAFFLLTAAALTASFAVTDRLSARQREQANLVGSLFLDAMNGLRSVRTFSAENYICNKYRYFARAEIRARAIIDCIAIGSRVAPALFILVVLAVGIAFAWPVGTTINDLPYIMVVVALLMRFFPTVDMIWSGVMRVIGDARAGHDVTEIIDRFDTHSFDHQAIPLDDHIRSIVAERLHFSYVEDKPVLNGLDLRLERGRSYALIGVSGSGKSTFFDLMLGFHAPAGGRLLVNNIPIDRISATDLRRHMLLFTQDAAIFNDTVANNLRLGLDASQIELEAACRIAAIHDFIASLPEGYETRLAYRGTNLSGGQRQRIGIARAVLRQPDVLLLDESTSALDIDTRAEVVRNLLIAYRDRIVVFVTHDTYVMEQVNSVIDMAVINGVPTPHSG